MIIYIISSIKYIYIKNIYDIINTILYYDIIYYLHCLTILDIINNVFDIYNYQSI